MACGSCGAKKFGKLPPPVGAKARTMPNPMAMQSPITYAAPVSPFLANMSLERRNIEQRRRMAALRALGK